MRFIPTVVLVALVTLSGCFAERSVRYSAALLPARPPVPAPRADSGRERGAAERSSMNEAPPENLQAAPRSLLVTSAVPVARNWLRRQHADLEQYLPKGERPALLTEDLTTSPGKARDVNAYFNVNPSTLHTILANYDGLKHSSQASGANYAIEQPAPPWPGFEDIWIPIDYAGFELSGRLGLARDERGNVRDADCIVILPGIFGDNSVERTRQIATALHDAGLHALALELRGCGQTERRFPNFGITWGTFEAGDLLAVSEWLEAQPHINRTGLVAFCWGSNVALITAWEDGRADDDPMVTPQLRKLVRPRSSRPHFQAGILVFSPCLPFENICDQTQTEWSLLSNPVLAKLQKEIRTRCERRAYDIPPYDLRALIDEEAKRSPASYPGGVQDGYQFLRLYPYKNEPWANKFESMRVPVLIVQGCNDPLTNAQPVADILAQTKNRNVAAVILPGGGHVGFAPYAPDYFYGLLFRFFDPERGVAATRESPGLPVVMRS